MIQPAMPAYMPGSGAFLPQDGGLSSREASSKLVYLFDLLRDRYVDTLNLQKLVDDAIPTIIQELDPHSAYFSQTELTEVNEQLDGSFSGIGVQFNIQNDMIQFSVAQNRELTIRKFKRHLKVQKALLSRLV